ncbi:MAG: S-4TM family putative pore-forming effector [Bacilli bacterium]|jgi:hypothetical protein
MSNQLFNNQNKPEQQQLIVTHHYVHRRAMFYSFSSFFVSVIVPLVLNIVMVIIKDEMLRTIFSFVAILLVILNVIIRSTLDKVKYYAAQVKQKFDLNVFDFSNKFGFNEEVVEKEIKRYRNKKLKRTRDIYQDYTHLSKNEATFLYQRDNIEQIETVVKKFKILISIITIIVGIVFMLSFIIDDITMSYAISILVNAIPLITYVVMGFSKMAYDDDLLSEIKNYSSKIKFLCKQSGKISIKLIENLQWMLFHYKKNQIFIPIWFEHAFYKQRSITTEMQENNQKPIKQVKKAPKKNINQQAIKETVPEIKKTIKEEIKKPKPQIKKVAKKETSKMTTPNNKKVPKKSGGNKKVSASKTRTK